MGQSRVAKRERKPTAVPGEEQTGLRVETLQTSPEPKRRVARTIVALLLGVVSASSAGFFLLTLHLNNWPVASLAAVAFYTTAWWAIRMTAAPPPRRQTRRPSRQQLRGWLPADAPPPSKVRRKASSPGAAASEACTPCTPCAPYAPEKPGKTRRYGTGC